jgi:tetratricopeptide (TPR) repeat protein
MLIRTTLIAVLLSGPSLAAAEDETSGDARRKADSLTHDEAVAAYQDAIDVIETQAGAFDPQLREPLVGLGLAYMQDGAYQEAAGAFQRALHVTRVNYGLHDLEQRPIVELLIKCHKAGKNWEAVDESYRYLLWLSRRNYGSGDAQMLPILKSVGEWHLAATELEKSGSPVNHLFEAEAAYAQAAEIMEKDPSVDRGELIEVLYAGSYANFRLAEWVTSNPDPFLFASTSLALSPYAEQRAIDAFAALERQLDLSYRRGRDSLRRVAALAAESQDPATHAAALTYLGDWYLQFGRRHSADAAYQEALAIAGQEPSARAAVDQLYQQPSLLPAIPLDIDEPLPVSELAPEEDRKFVVFDFDIAENGRVTRIDVAETGGDASSGDIRNARGWLRQTRFRPMVVDGKPQPYSGARIRYFLDGGE